MRLVCDIAILTLARFRLVATVANLQNSILNLNLNYLHLWSLIFNLSHFLLKLIL